MVDLAINQKQSFFLEKLFVFSIIFEPLLYFQLINVNDVGIGTHISRVLQVLVILGLLTRVIFSSKGIGLFFPDFFSNKFNFFWLYFIAGIFSTVMGYGVWGNYFIFSGDLIVSRVVIEVVISLYYFFYFVVFSLYFLKSNTMIDYFFKMFYAIFLLSIMLGVLDLILQYCFSYDLVSRHLIDATDVGFRFHGFFGEPRDAYGALILFASVLCLKRYKEGRGYFRPSSGLLIFLGLLTFSVSAILGIICTGILIIIFSCIKFNAKQNVKFFAVVFLLFFIGVSYINSSNRLLIYMDDFVFLYEHLEALIRSPTQFGHIGLLLGPQSVDVFPILDILRELKGFNVFQFIWGHGIGSASVLNQNYMSFIGVSNPRSNIIRLLYDNGVIGSLLFLWIFLSPMKLIGSYRKEITITMLFILGAFLAHRSSIPYIYLGILLSVVRQKNLSLMLHSKTLST